jgi:hypothetical protein
MIMYTHSVPSGSESRLFPRPWHGRPPVVFWIFEGARQLGPPGHENEGSKRRAAVSSSRRYRVMGAGSMDDLGNPIRARFLFP